MRALQFEIETGIPIPPANRPQLQRCEDSARPKRECDCRCRGEFHGSNRDVRKLGPGDPHFDEK